MKLSKGETNELLLRISEDNYQYGCIFKLIYVYAKESKPVLLLKWCDIDTDKMTIVFDGKVYPLLPVLSEELDRLDKYGDFVFVDDNRVHRDGLDTVVNEFRKKLQYYLGYTIKRLEVDYHGTHKSLSITDLRRLRGQHLLRDNVPLNVIMELYSRNLCNVASFKDFLEYEEIYDEVHYCSNMDDLFKLYTDLSIFDFESSDNNKEYFVASNSKGDSIVVCIGDDGVNVVEGDGIKVNNLMVSEVNRLYNNGSLNTLSVLKGYEFKSVDGLNFVRM